MNEWINKWIFHFQTNLHLYSWNKHIRNETTFLPEKRHFIYISLQWTTNKVQRFSFQKAKWGKPKIITRFPPFLIILLNVSIWLFLIANGKACIICRTAIVKCAACLVLFKILRVVTTFQIVSIIQVQK